MTAPLWFENLTAYSAQVGLLILCVGVLISLLRLRDPRARLRSLQVLFLASLALPWLQPWRLPVPARITVSVVESIASSPVPAGAARSFAFDPFKLILWILISGCIWKLGMLVAGVYRLGRYRREARSLQPMPDVFEEARLRLGVKAQAFVSESVSSPATFGFRDAVILFPHAFLNADEPCQRAIAIHELLHVRHRHWILVIAEECARALFWFHPAVRWLFDKIRLAREQVVDQEVLRLTQEKESYLNALLWVASLKNRSLTAPAPSFSTERHLVKRVALLTTEVSMSKTRIVACIAVLLGVTLGTGVLAVRAFPIKAPSSSIDAHEMVHETAAAPVPPATSPEMTSEKSSATTQAADSQGTIRGMVSDPTGGVIPGARITLYDPRTNEVLEETLSDGSGQFQLHRFRAEGQALKIEYPGFAQHVMTSSFLGKDRLDISLKLGTIAETVKVTAAAPQSSSAIRVIRNEEPTRSQESFIPAKVLHSVSPVYPQAAKDARVSGRVVLEVTVNEKGVVIDTRIVRGHPLLDAAALEAVRRYQFSPATKNAIPVASVTRIEINFLLDSSAAGKPEPIRVGGNIQESKLVTKVPPIYPEEAKQARISGIVILQVTVSETGEVEDVQILRGHPLLNAAVTDAVRQWKYSPTLLNGMPVRVMASVTVVYELR